MQGRPVTLIAMASFAFQHLKATRNIGDRVATPARWFDFGPAPVQNLGETLPPCDIAIFGGGQIYSHVLDALIHRSAAARHCVAWGIGLHSINRQTLRYDIFEAGLSLIGCRDTGIPGTRYVPCASCMARAFDQPPTPEHEVVLYLHGHKSAALQKPAGIPTRTNLEGNFAEALRFIASGETVVSNSFHGTYWAMLMGRRTLCLPFSSKFHGFARMPALADPADWQSALRSAHSLPGYLNECRAANRAFHAEVMALAQS